MNELDKLRPRPMEYEGWWQAIQVEPIPGSGERITTCVAAIGEDGETKVVSTLSIKAARCLYGDNAAVLVDMANIIVDSLGIHLQEHESMESWAPEISDFHIGKAQHSVAHDINGLIEQAILSTASLGNVKEALSEEEIVQTQFKTAVRRALIDINKAYKHNINQTITTNKNGYPRRYGFVANNYIANYTAISTNTPSYDAAIVRMVELEDLLIDDYTTANKIELLLAPSTTFWGNKTTDDKTIKAQIEKRDRVIREAEKRKIKAIHFEGPDRVAMHLHRQAA